MTPLSKFAAKHRLTFSRLIVLTIAAIAMLTLSMESVRAAPPTIETSAKQAILVDFDTAAVLFAKNADDRMPPSSMAKMMTLYILFQRIKEGRVKMDDTLAVSERAWRTGGSKMFVQVGSRVRIEDLIQGIAVQSGNDACIVVAEGLAGSEEAFAQEMNKTAKDLGLKNSNFTDSSGLPDPNQYVSARDLALLARRLILDFPEEYHVFSEIDFTYNGIKQGNRNPLLYKKVGVDGLKTGHTDAGGYGLTASAMREGRRLVLVLNGMNSVNERSRESEKLLDWGYREWANYALFKAGDKVDDAQVWLGVQPTVPLVVDQNLVATMPHLDRDKMKVTVSYDAPIPATVVKGTVVGKVTVETPDTPTIELPIKAADSVERLGFFGRIRAAFSQLLWGPSK